MALFWRKSIGNEKKNYFETIKSRSLKEVLEERLYSLEPRGTLAGMFMMTLCRIPSRGRKWSRKRSRRRKRKSRNCLQH